MKLPALAKLFVLALLLLPAALVASPGTVSAEETQATVRARLLTTAEFKRAIERTDSKVIFGNSTDVDVSTDQLFGVGRRWEGTDGSLMYIAIQTYKDGSALSRGDRGYLMRGDYARQVMTSAYGGYEEKGEPEEFFDENDVIQQFSVKDAGKTYDVLTVTFVNGNLFGIVMYTTPLTNQGVELGATYGTMYEKLR